MIHLFGPSTASGHSFFRVAVSSQKLGPVICCSRNPSGDSQSLFADFSDPASFLPAVAPRSSTVWISFAPIWLFAPFLEHLRCCNPDRLLGLRGVIACSSSSALTKRFASNSFDRELVENLVSSESQLLSTCRSLSIPCHIVQPTMIYGRIGNYEDRNLSLLLKLMHRLPILPLPAQTGLRQPIHASQLAAVIYHLAQQLALPSSATTLPARIALGGDTTLTYAEMLTSLKRVHSSSQPPPRCFLLSIPNRLFFLLATPLMLRSPKDFEAVLRIASNLSGFTAAHQLLGSNPQPFPVFPLA